MTCRLLSDKPSCGLMWLCCQLDRRNKLQTSVKLKQNTTILVWWYYLSVKWQSFPPVLKILHPPVITASHTICRTQENFHNVLRNTNSLKIMLFLTLEKLLQLQYSSLWIPIPENTMDWIPELWCVLGINCNQYNVMKICLLVNVYPIIYIYIGMLDTAWKRHEKPICIHVAARVWGQRWNKHDNNEVSC